MWVNHNTSYPDPPPAELPGRRRGPGGQLERGLLLRRGAHFLDWQHRHPVELLPHPQAGGLRAVLGVRRRLQQL